MNGGRTASSSPIGTNDVAATPAAIDGAGTLPGAVRSPNTAYSNAKPATSAASPTAKRYQPRRFSGRRTMMAAASAQSSSPNSPKAGGTLPRRAMAASGNGVDALMTASATVVIHTAIPSAKATLARRAITARVLTDAPAARRSHGRAAPSRGPRRSDARERRRARPGHGAGR